MLVAHIWQSTLFAGVCWLITLGLRRNSASIRYWVWFAVSVKFLVPFAPLVGLGVLLPHRVSVPLVQTSRVMTTIDEVGQTLVTPSIAVTASRAGSNPISLIALSLWACGFLGVGICWMRRYWRTWMLRQSAVPMEVSSGSDLPVRILSAPGLVEPGAFGIFRPVLLLPEGIAGQLSAPQLEAVLAHELCHVRRRDNLTAAIHMVVQATFWFHPLVWWLGARLIDERERACDEEVVGLGSEPRIYAQGILRVCELYLESQVACVAGVTGASLKKRIEAIMKNRITWQLSFGKKLTLATASVAALAVPVSIGILHAQETADWQTAAGGKMSFEVASVKLTQGAGSPPLFPLDNGDAFAQTGGRFYAAFPLSSYILFAYKLSPPTEDQRKIMFEHVPQSLWMERYTIEAKAPASATKDQMRLMMQSVLAERFKLAVHSESKKSAVYALTLVKSGKAGPKLIPHEPGPACDAAPNPNIFPPTCYSMMSRRGPMGMLMGSRNTTMPLLAGGLLGPSGVDHPIVDQTGLKGGVDFTLEWAPDSSSLFGRLPLPPGVEPPPQADGPSFTDALRDQLGLKLESTKGQVQFLIVDHIERPSEN
jgi:bla regulator protein BlaR1